ncbi:MAG: hypothetical protein WCO25_00795 [Candidatus Uhrbacteria bacterium]
MIKINPSVRQWVLSFLAVDLLFWLLVGFGCVTDPVSCLETWSFGSFFFYFPMVFIPLPNLGAIGGVDVGMYLIPVFGILSHALLGLFVGWVLRKTRIAWFVSIAVALVVLFVGSFAAAYYNFKAEQARESKPAVPTQQEVVWSSWADYSDPAGRFDLRVAPDMVATTSQEPYNRLSDVAVAYSTDKASYHPINYSQSSWFVVSSQSVDETACYASVDGGQLAFSDEQTIGATTFKVASATDAGAGNRYEQTIYRTYLNATCYEISTTLHYASDFTDIDESAMNASQATARTALSDMVSTFRFNLDNSQGL